MKEVQIRRHAEKDQNGVLTEIGINDAKALATKLPKFAKVISSKSERAILTAKILTGIDAEVNKRAGFYMASPDSSQRINSLAVNNKCTFLEAVVIDNNPVVLGGIDAQATALNSLIDETLDSIHDGQFALIISRDLSISPAVAQRGIPLESIEPLGGYIVRIDGSVVSISSTS